MEEWLFCVKGRVQGVGYRASVLRFVLQNNLQIKGYVKNLYDGNVEVCAQGTAKELEVLLAFLKEGPRMSKVAKVDISKRKDLSFFESFTIEH